MSVRDPFANTNFNSNYKLFIVWSVSIHFWYPHQCSNVSWRPNGIVSLFSTSGPVQLANANAMIHIHHLLRIAGGSIVQHSVPLCDTKQPYRLLPVKLITLAELVTACSLRDGMRSLRKQSPDSHRKLHQSSDWTKLRSRVPVKWSVKEQ